MVYHKSFKKLSINFAEVFKNAPRQIHVSCGDQKDKLKKGWYRDKLHINKQVSEDFTEGDGTSEHPYTYISAYDVSAYYCIIDLWYAFRTHASWRRKSVFIEANDWILTITPAGVRAEDGVFTKLI